MSKKQTHRIHIWDDPESKIHLLEMVGKEKGFDAIIYDPDMDAKGSERMRNLASRFKEEGYATHLKTDEHGNPALHLEKVGAEETFLTSIEKLGLVKGIKHSIDHIGDNVASYIGIAKDMIKFGFGNKAKAIGTVYLIGDISMGLQGLLNNKSDQQSQHKGFEKYKDPVNLLPSFAALMSLVQSLIYMIFAKEGHETLMDALEKDWKELKTAKNGELKDYNEWFKELETKQESTADKVGYFMHERAIPAGAIAQIIGQIGLLASGGILYNRWKNETRGGAKDLVKGAKKDMFTALSSIVGWILVSQPERKPGQKSGWHSPRRLIQEVAEKPNRFAAMFTGLAAVLGVSAGGDKDNKAQLYGNAIYMIGDVLIFLTENNEYREGAQNQAEKLAEVATKFLESFPVAMGENEKDQFIQNLSHYLATRMERINTPEAAENEERKDLSKEGRMNKMTQDIRAAMLNMSPEPTFKLDKITAAAADIIAHFPQEKRQAIINSVSKVLTDIPQIDAQEVEIQSMIKNYVIRKNLPAPSTQLVQMKDLEQPLANVILAIPGMNGGDYALSLYDAVSSAMRLQESDLNRLNDALIKQSEQDIKRVMAPENSKQEQVLQQTNSSFPEFR